MAKKPVNMQALVPSLVVFLLLLSPSSHGQFDFFKLVQTWPPTYCVSKPITHYPCVRIVHNFTIHGLWPETFTSTRTCPSILYDKFDPLSDITIALDERWPDLERSSERTQLYQDFWKHEWTTHGTCSANMYDRRSYFGLAMEMKDKFYLLKILEIAGIMPGMTVNVEWIRIAVAAKTGKEPIIKCATPDPSRTKVDQNKNPNPSSSSTSQVEYESADNLIFGSVGSWSHLSMTRMSTPSVTFTTRVGIPERLKNSASGTVTVYDKSKPNTLELLEIIICWAQDGKSVIDCPGQSSHQSCYDPSNTGFVYFRPDPSEVK